VNREDVMRIEESLKRYLMIKLGVFIPETESPGLRADVDPRKYLDDSDEEADCLSYRPPVINPALIVPSI
jgi:hypothetical protein